MPGVFQMVRQSGNADPRISG